MTKSGSESSLSETCDKQESQKQSNEPECKDSIAIDKGESTKVVQKDILDVPISNSAKRGSLTSAKSLHELKRDVIDECSSSDHQQSKTDKSEPKSDETSGKSKGIRPSKSETSIIDSFVFVEKKLNSNYLREGEKY